MLFNDNSKRKLIDWRFFMYALTLQEMLFLFALKNEIEFYELNVQ